jgi:hypothetical protein
MMQQLKWKSEKSARVWHEIRIEVPKPARKMSKSANQMPKPVKISKPASRMQKPAF